MALIAGLFETHESACSALQRLHDAGIDPDAIGMATRIDPQENTPAPSAPQESDEQDSESDDVVPVDWRAKLLNHHSVRSTIVVPGIGSVFLGGTLAAVMAGARITMGSDSLVGALLALGMNETDCKTYADRIRKGDVALFVEIPGEQETATRRAMEPPAETRKVSEASSEGVAG